MVTLKLLRQFQSTVYLINFCSLKQIMVEAPKKWGAVGTQHILRSDLPRILF